MDNFEQMIKEYHPIIYKICRVYSNDEDFDDLYQEVLISLWKNMMAKKSILNRAKKALSISIISFLFTSCI